MVSDDMKLIYQGVIHTCEYYFMTEAARICITLVMTTEIFSKETHPLHVSETYSLQLAIKEKRCVFLRHCFWENSLSISVYMTLCNIK